MLSQAPAAPSAFPSGPSPSPLDSAYDFGALAEDRQDAAQAAAVHPAPASGTQGCILQTSEHLAVSAYCFIQWLTRAYECGQVSI